ncbi:aryl hydrocarbon receptor-like [Megalops cyprinoides]|uniref:aryl hydrocarbon receptor-like n=1 Tax=Megalops cyprinoides TaxID=118141 RepID=UPI00186420B8|nr:aryl hydrocarbon receptor-like [Megalops cyprinoides]
MLGNGVYAVKKRKKPVKKIPKPPPPDGVKSNPSKRHRDRLNGELDKLTSLLPFSEDVRARLDKLSVLRLSVGYLKVKSFFNATMRKGSVGWPGDRSEGLHSNGQSGTSTDGVTFSEGDLLLQALNGFVLVVTAEGYVFYASPTIQDYLGFHQSDVVHQSVFELIHTDDRAMFRRQLHFALNPNQLSSEQGGDGMQSSSDISSNIVSYDPQHIPPENSSFLERSFCCRFRCLLDNSSGFLALNFQGRLKYLHGQNRMAEDGSVAHPQLALFVIAMPVQPPSILEIRTKTLIFQTKHKLDFTPMGIDTRGKVVLGYTELELCMRGSGYQFIHAADMMYCADNHVRMIKTGESGFTVFRLLTKAGVWVWVQANARLVYKGGRPDFIIARQRALTNEEGEENLRQRKMQLPFSFATGEALLYETSPTLEMPDITGNSKGPKLRKMPEPKGLDPDSLLGSMLKQHQSLHMQTPDSDAQLPLDKAFMDSHALVNVPGDAWQEGIPRSKCGFKEEATVTAMIDSLEQIISDDSLCSTLQDLDVDAMELKEWENALLRMNISGDMSDEFSDIVTNDILSYVEDALFKESNKSQCVRGSELLSSVPPNGVASTPLGNQNAFVRGPVGLPGLELQNSHFNKIFCPVLLGDPQNPVITNPQTNFLGLGGQSLQVAGLMHVSPQVPMELSDPTQTQPKLQLIQPNDIFTQSVGPAQINSQSALGQSNPISLNAALPGSFPQMQKQVRQRLPSSQTVFSPSLTKLNGFGPFLQRELQTAPQGTAGQLHPCPVALSFQNQQQGQQIAFQQQNSVNQSSHMASGEGDGWLPSIPNTNVADSLLDVCALNSSAQQELFLDPVPSTCFQGQFSLQTQNNIRQHSWQQQHLSTTAPTGHQPPPDCHSQAPGFQRNSHAGILPQNWQNSRAGFGPQKTPNGVYPTQTVLVDNAPPSSNSCMFNSTSSLPVPGMQFSNVGMAASVFSCQNSKPSQNDGHPQPHPCFQRSTDDSILGISGIPQEDSSITPLSCRITPNFSPKSLLAPQQYLNCSEPTQLTNCLLEENRSFPIPPLANGTILFSENNQANCCDL